MPNPITAATTPLKSGTCKAAATPVLVAAAPADVVLVTIVFPACSAFKIPIPPTSVELAHSESASKAAVALKVISAHFQDVGISNNGRDFQKANKEAEKEYMKGESGENRKHAWRI